MKALIEKRNALLTEMENIVKKAQTETRAFDEKENARYEAIKVEIAGLDKTIKADAETRSFEKMKVASPEVDKVDVETRAFENYIRGVVETRADVNLTVSDNGAVIPKTIAQKIIKKVYDTCPIYQLSTKYNVGGTLNIPTYDEATQAITMAYATEFTDLASTSGKFATIELKGYLAGALSKISKSLINNSQFNLVDYTVNAMAENISLFIENEIINGTTDKVTGLSGVAAAQTVTAASATAVTADEIIDLQETVPDQYQANAIFVMSRATRKAIRKLKDGDGTYLLQKDSQAKWGYTLFGKDVYVSCKMPDMASANKAIFYGDFSGLAIKLAENISIEVLREKFATQHAIGVVGWVEIDSKIENVQKIACLKMKTV